MVTIQESKFLTSARLGDVIAVQRYLSQGVNVNVQEDGTGSTPLHKAARSGHTDLVLLLLYNGADKHIRNFQSKLPSEVAKTNYLSELIHNFHRIERTGPIIHRRPESPIIERQFYGVQDYKEKEFHRDVQQRLIKQQRKLEAYKLLLQEKNAIIQQLVFHHEEALRNTFVTESEVVKVFRQILKEPQWQHRLSETNIAEISVYDLVQGLRSVDC